MKAKEPKDGVVVPYGNEYFVLTEAKTNKT